ncbi:MULTISPECIES: flavin reductase family protein [unclassified Corynebacterium]|uniref:flavin reductase family protein n=1 Tax=unclassified Corynebacterium TaxID=2624378 RepID=UPI0029CA9588|nr:MULTISPECIES: flavin reductase family protein [unclassified Corynebacterium]WPF65677.1 flavin reductase family protein [Corynebacterium sp. 22KM0430]WPF68173.1 flavin reductase family protein [Corynebacterium sp. 21KM1197]
MHKSTDPLEVRRTFGAYPTGIALTAGISGAAPAGLLTNSFTSISLDPPLVAVSFDHGSTSWPRLRNITTLGISIFSSENLDAAHLLRRPTDVRFDGVDYHIAQETALLIPRAAAHLIVTPERTIEAGDHTLVLFRVLEHEHTPEATPLVFHDSTIFPLPH